MSKETSKNVDSAVEQREKKKPVKARSLSRVKKELPVEPVIKKNTAECLKLLSKYIREKDNNKIIDKLIMFYVLRVNVTSYDVNKIIKKLRA